MNIKSPQKESNKKLFRSETALLVFILIIFVSFTSIYSLYTPTWEESDGSFHWSNIREVSSGTYQWNRYSWNPPLYYIITGGILSLFDPAEFADDDLEHHKFNFYEDHNKFRHVTKDEFKFGEENFQRGCVGGPCTGMSEEFPFSGVSLGVHTLRFFSIFLGVITLIFVYKISKLVFKNNKWLPLFTVSFTAFIPQFTYINSVLTTESLAITLSTIVIFFLLKFVKNLTNLKFLFLLSIFTGIALITKMTALFLVPVGFFTFLYLFRIGKLRRIDFLRTLGIFVAILILSGGWWYLVVETYLGTNIVEISRDISEFELGQDDDLNQKFEEGKIQNLLDFRHHHFIFFESMWGNIGWKAIKTDPFFLDIVKTMLLFSFGGLIFSIISNYYKKKNTIDKTDLTVFVFTVSFMVLFMLLNQYNTGLGTGRNLLPSVVGFSILVSTGLYFFVGRNRLKPLLLLPLAFLIFLNVSFFFEMNEKFEHGFPRDPIYDANHDLKTEIWLGKGTHQQETNIPKTRLRNAWLEDGGRHVALLIHPPENGERWWNFTMSIPDNKNYDLQISYGYLINAKGRTDPVEFSVFFDDGTMMQDTKYFTGKLSNFEVDLDKYRDEKIRISLSTDSLDYNVYKAWTFFKLKFIK